MFSNLAKYKSLGVINRTPNSFSDQGLSLNPEHFNLQMQSFLNDPSVIIDVGFESSAPMNQAVSLEVERERFESFLEASKNFNFEDRYISFDTYKIKNFKYMVHEFKKIHPKAHFIFNDVSGDLGEELKEALFEFKHTSFYYIYTFSHIPERAQTLDHMKFINENEDVIETTAGFFKSAFEWFKVLGMEHQLILDPGFGFSKTYDQNWKLINNFFELEESLLEMKLNNPILIGLSKKSFLKKALGTDNPEDLEKLHLECIRKISNSRVMNLLFRVHDVNILRKY